MSDRRAEQTLEEKRANRRFLVAKEGRKYEIDKFWQRSSFFWVFIAAAFVAYGKADPGDRFPFACFGLVSSFAWTLQNRGSKYWQEAWEQKVDRIEVAVLGEQVFHCIEPTEGNKGPWGAHRFSVSRLTIAVSDFSVLVWLALSIFASHSVDETFRTHWRLVYNIALGGTLFYCAAILVYSRDRKNKE